MIHSFYRQLKLISYGLLIYSSMALAWAAVPAELEHAQTSTLAAIVKPTNAMPQTKNLGLQVISQDTDFNGTLHIRVQETYAGYLIWGADAVLHIPKNEANKVTKSLANIAALRQAAMNGTLYQNLEAELQNPPAYIFSQAQKAKALNNAIGLYQKSAQADLIVSNKESSLMVYIDKWHKAHWVYLVKFMAKDNKSIPANPVYILDAFTLQLYKTWDDIRTFDVVRAGGYGGNEKTGKRIYDDMLGHYSAFALLRDPLNKICYLKNDDIVIRDARSGFDASQFNCFAPDSKHHNIYWDGNLDAINGAYAPGNDAFYNARIVKNLYQDWYGVPVVLDMITRKPMQIIIFLHESYMGENAQWLFSHLSVGDGGNNYYPLVSLDVIAHELSHGFTFSHSILSSTDQAGGLSEAFSDMAAQAAAFYATGHNSWRLGEDILKAKGKADRYMDNPILDCNSRAPGDNCSIDNIKDYKPDMNPHFSAGVFNKVFYLISTSPEWDVRKAFNIMVQANRYYWTSHTDFNHAACSVMQATKDYHYNTAAVIAAFLQAGIDVSRC